MKIIIIEDNDYVELLDQLYKYEVQLNWYHDLKCIKKIKDLSYNIRNNTYNKMDVEYHDKPTTIK